MNGRAWVKYDLRPNKAMERYLFVELLRMLGTEWPISDYSYYGLGGCGFEDFRLIHLQLGISRMFSFEKDEDTYKRQKFNKPFKCIKICNKDTGHFVDEAEKYKVGEKSSIIWLDYDEANKRMDQIQELRRLIPKLKEKDVVKITLNANPRTLFDSQYFACDNSGPKESLSDKEVRERRLERYKRDIEQRYRRSSLSEEDMKVANFPKVLLYALRIVAEEASKETGRKIEPVASFLYNDLWHQMLTFTGIVKSDTAPTETLPSPVLNWEFRMKAWESYNHIVLPEFTTKEKILIDSLLPLKSINNAMKTIKKHKLPFSEKQIEEYSKCYRQYPDFRQILL